ncbi:MAG: outer membrane lipid asymmetry maintenance protein MlaD [Alphaproteobacteria bacterium]|nr:outer membrane lipid asymmetry maintenance protein MlaD [Alphaproteobacteria bacterium]
MKTNLLEVGMGAAVLIACAFFGIFVYSTSQWKTPQGYEVIAKFDRIDGLMRGGDVRLSGVKVGNIKDIHLDPQTYMAVVHMHVASYVSLPTDTSAEIVSDGLLGGKVMALVPGGEEKMIPPGGEIKFTQAAISLEHLIGQFIFNAQDKKEESPVEKASSTVIK